MKKKRYFIIISILLAIILYYTILPDYHILTSSIVTFSNDDVRNIELQVIAYHYLNIDKLIQKIEAEHNQLNGVPSTLTINLYRSKWSLRNGYKPFYTTTINYIQKSRQS